MINDQVGVSCRREGAEVKTMTGIKPGQTWEGRIRDDRGKLYYRTVLGGEGWLIRYLGQDGRKSQCTALTWQKWVEQWDARPVEVSK